MRIAMIAAIGENNVIGKDNDLVWNLPDDMKYFMTTTSGHHVIMGRKNYESIPPKYRPLPGRTNIIITRQESYEAPGASVVHDLDQGLKIARDNGEQEVFIIGGGQIYEMALGRADILYLTEIQASFEGDTYFPAFDKNNWDEVARVHHKKDERHAYAFDFVTYSRKK